MPFLAGGKDDPNKKAWIQHIGMYRYYSLVLAGFDPIRAEAIYDNPAHVVAEAFVSKIVSEHIDK